MGRVMDGSDKFKVWTVQFQISPTRLTYLIETPQCHHGCLPRGIKQGNSITYRDLHIINKTRGTSTEKYRKFQGQLCYLTKEGETGEMCSLPVLANVAGRHHQTNNALSLAGLSWFAGGPKLHSYKLVQRRRSRWDSVDERWKSRRT